MLLTHWEKKRERGGLQGGDIERGKEKEEGGGEGERWRGGEKGREGKRRGGICLRIRNSSLPGFMPQTLWDIKI